AEGGDGAVAGRAGPAEVDGHGLVEDQPAPVPGRRAEIEREPAEGLATTGQPVEGGAVARVEATAGVPGREVASEVDVDGRRRGRRAWHRGPRTMRAPPGY